MGVREWGRAGIGLPDRNRRHEALAWGQRF